MKNSPYTVSILVPVYNDAENIGNLINCLLNQKTSEDFVIKEIVVVASGCTDETERIVKGFDNNGKVKLLIQKTRKGKASAINLFLRTATCDIIVMESADTMPAEEFVINNLLKPFLNERIGITAGRPICLNNVNKLATRINSSIWHLHHQISLRCPPKVGEIIAFRNVIKKIPEKTAVDEETISALIQQRGYDAVYVYDAVVYNKGPENISELFRQRKRIFMGHLWVKENQHYIVPSMNILRLARVVLEEIAKNPKKIFTLVPIIFLEIIIRLTAIYDLYIRKKNEYMWERIASTKRLI